VAQAVRLRLPTAEPRATPWGLHARFTVDEVAVGQDFLVFFV
jgi:hypothetical protein